MKTLLAAFLIFCPGIAHAGNGVARLYDLNYVSLSLSTLPRLDFLKGELLWPDDRVGISASAMAVRKGNWKYSVHERSFDRWGNLTGESLSSTKSSSLVDYLPVTAYMLPYTWTRADGKLGNIRLFYEYSASWLAKDQINTSVNCDYGNNSLGGRTVQDYGVIVDPGGALRFRAGQARIKRGASHCDDSENGKRYDFSALKVSQWYAGVEISFGPKSAKASRDASVTAAEENTPLADELFERIIGKAQAEKQALAMAKPARLKVSNLVFKNTADDKNTLTGGDAATIDFSMENYGGLARNLKAFVECSDSHIEVPSRLELGNLDPGENKQVHIPLTASQKLEDGNATLNISFEETNGNPPAPLAIKFKTSKLIPPEFEIAGVNIDDGSYKDPDRLAFGNGNGILEPGESAEITVLLKNNGGDARNVDAELIVDGKNSELRKLADKEIKETYKIGTMGHNDWKKLKFAVSVSKLYKLSRKYPLALKVTEQRPDFSRDISLAVAINEALPIIQRIYITPEPEKTRNAAPIPTFGGELLKIPDSSSVNKDAVAVVIGVKNYSKQTVPTVDYALNDAGLVKAYLEKALGYREGNIIYLENPTKADFEKVFGNKDNPEGQLYDYVRKGKSDVFVYYTGHGAPDLGSKEGYFVPADSDPNYVKFSGYPLNVFYRNLSRIPARKITVVIDACFSGMSDKGTIIKEASPLLVVPKIPGAGKMDIFTSSRADEISSWYPDKGHSLFTYYFLKGLQGAADKNKDKKVSYGELAEYISENVGYYARRLYGRKQNPTFTGAKDEIFARYK